MPGGTESYRDQSANARLVAALLAVEAWLAKVGIEDSGLGELLEHLWVWPTVDTEQFREWSGWSSEVLEAGLGGDLPPRLREACVSAKVSEQELVELLRHLVELVYAHLYGEVDNEESMRDLRHVEMLLGRYAVELPSPSLFADDCYDDRDGWGRRRSPGEIAALRKAASNVAAHD